MSKVKKQPKRQLITDDFNELGTRGRTAVEEQAVVHSVVEDSGKDAPLFQVEARVIVQLEDGRTLNKVFDLEYDEDDVEL